VRVSVEKRFNSLVREHNSEVRNYLGRRLYPLGTIDLDDLVEETWIVVWRRVDRVPVSEPLPWLIGVARNVLRNAKRAHNRRDHYEGQVIASHSQPSAEEVTSAQSTVLDALLSLSDDDQEILTLNAWEGFSLREIASLFNISENAAAVRLTRAEQRFKVAFEGIGVS
jgi:RNA polymerase sigma-70 factor (ECF subfamily)